MADFNALVTLLSLFYNVISMTCTVRHAKENVRKVSASRGKGIPSHNDAMNLILPRRVVNIVNIYTYSFVYI